MFFTGTKSKMTANGIDMLVKNATKEVQAINDDLKGFDNIEGMIDQLSQMAKTNGDVASSTLLGMIKMNMDEKQNNMANKLRRLQETLKEIDQETDRIQ
ncbi:MAG: hypothetical protein RR192_02630 [Peptostreptococcaceae bacterium]